MSKTFTVKKDVISFEVAKKVKTENNELKNYFYSFVVHFVVNFVQRKIFLLIKIYKWFFYFSWFFLCTALDEGFIRVMEMRSDPYYVYMYVCVCFSECDLCDEVKKLATHSQMKRSNKSIEYSSCSSSSSFKCSFNREQYSQEENLHFNHIEIHAKQYKHTEFVKSMHVCTVRLANLLLFSKMLYF